MAKKKTRVTSSAAPPLDDDLPTIVADGTWDSSTTASHANTLEHTFTSSYHIRLKNIPKHPKPRFNDLQCSQINALLTNRVPPSPKDGTNPQATPANHPIHGSSLHGAPNKADRGNNAHTTATNPSPPAHPVPAQCAPAQQHGPAQLAPAHGPAQHAPAQHARAQHAPAQHAPTQPSPAEEASVAPSAVSDRLDSAQSPKTSAKTHNGIWLPPHLRTPVPIIPIVLSRKPISSSNAKSGEANRNTRANTNGNSLKASSSDCANVNGSSAKADPLPTSVSATSTAPVNADVSTAKDKPTEATPSALSNVNDSATKDKPTEATPSAVSIANVPIAKLKSTGATLRALSNGNDSTAKDKSTEATPSVVSNAKSSTATHDRAEVKASTFSNADVSTVKDKPTGTNLSALPNSNGDSTSREPVESNSRATVEIHASNAKVESVEPNSSGLLRPDVSNIPPPLTEISKGKQPELEAADGIPTPRGGLSNVSMNSHMSVTERRGYKKETLEFEHPLAGWDGNWGPAPVEWCGRPSFDQQDTHHVKSMHNWLLERAREALHNPSMLNITDPGFTTGEALAAGDVVLGSPIDKKWHDTILPDDEFTKVKVGETADDRVKKHQSKIEHEKQETKTERRLFRQAMREAQASWATLPHPHAPAANIYIRPAEGRDMKQIAELYNHYIVHSVVTAEIEPLSEQQWRARWTEATQSNYAFLVAVQLSGKGGGNNRRSKQETICGFAYADDFGDADNTYRYSCELQCYVGNWTLRMGVGRSLMDRILAALDPVYPVRGGARFEGGADPIRYDGGGVRVISKVVISLLYPAKEEAHLKWQKEWLAKFKFEHVSTLPGIGRKFDKV